MTRIQTLTLPTAPGVMPLSGTGLHTPDTYAAPGILTADRQPAG